MSSKKAPQNMTPKEIYKNYKLSELAELANITFSCTFWKTTIEQGKYSSFKRYWYHTNFKRNGQKVHFNMFNTTDINTALNNLRVDIDLLFDIFDNGQENYKKWRNLYIESMGNEGDTRKSTFELQIREYKSMKKFLGKWFPVLLYAENDI